jgi:Phosphosulfolactate phosphohydrolase and related enzymes
VKVNIVDGRKETKFSENPKLLVDIYRSTTTMPMMLNKGAIKIIPTDSISEAKRIKRDNKSFILAGERYGFKVPGFEMSNSPYEVSKRDLSGKTVILTSTNGTKVLEKIRGSGEVYITSYVNFSATASCLTNEMEIDVVVSGRPDGKADEDYYFAQFTKEYFEEGRKEFNKYIELTKKGTGTTRLSIIGGGKDIPFCLSVDIVDFPVIYTNGMIIRKPQE